MARRAFGLNLHAAFDFPEIAISGEDDAARVLVELDPTAPSPEPGWRREVDGAAYGYRGPDGAPCGARVGTAPPAIRIASGPGVAPEVARLVALGPGLAGLLTLLGVPVLHGNTVRIAGFDALITGPSGVGKSTLTAALLARGAGLVADDVAALDLGPGGAVVRRGFGRIKLWDDAIAHLGGDPAALPRVHPAFDKRSVSVPVVDGPAPLRAIVELTREDEPPARVRGDAAVRVLLANARVPELIGPVEQPAWLRACAALAREVPVWRVGGAGLHAIPAVCARVEALAAAG